MEQQNQQPNHQPNQIPINEQKRKMSKRITIALLALAAVLIVVGGIVLVVNYISPGEIDLVDDTPLQSNRQLAYQSQSECEAATQSECIYYLCDIPLGELYQQLCVIAGTGSGWYSTVYINRFADDEEEDEEIDTSNWQTHRNEEFGFEVKFPEDWYAVSVKGESAVQISSRSENLQVSISDVSKFQEFSDIFEALIDMEIGVPYEKDLGVYTKLEDLQIGGVPAIRFKGARKEIPFPDIEPPISELVLFKKDSHIFQVFFGFQGQVLNQHKELLNQILSTFRFTP